MQRLEIPSSGGEPYTRLEPGGEFRIGRAIELHFLDHLSAPEKGFERLEDFSPAVEESRSAGTERLNFLTI
jgi:hypothetical protein